MKIKVTLGVCLRNCEKDIKRIADRICSQDFPHEKMEVIFVEEGSQDNTYYEILKIASRMTMSCKVYHHTWKGLGYSRNVILQNGQGEYLVWIDDGTIIPKDYVRQQVEFIEKHSTLGIVRGFICAYSGSNPVATLENMGELVFSHKHAGKNTKVCVPTPGCVYRVKAAKQVGGFDEDIKGASEDTEIAYKLLSAGWQIHITRVEYSVEHNEELGKVWKKSLWYGYGGHFVVHKHKGLREIVYKNTPMAGFLEGVFVFSIAYKLTRKKIAFLLPVFYFSKRLAWCIGFSKSHIASYGHKKRFLTSR